MYVAYYNHFAAYPRRLAFFDFRLLVGIVRIPMADAFVEVEFQRFWRRLQQLGLNAYESRSYLVLLGHPKFKALELAARAHVPAKNL